jgi:hypothetical protein
VFRASYGVFYARQNMLSQVGSITTNGVQQQTISGRPVWPGILTPPSTVDPCINNGVSNPFPCGSGVRVFSRDYENPRIYSTNVAYERQIINDLTVYADFTHSKGVHLTRFLNVNRNNIFGPFLGEVMVTSAVGKSLYRGLTLGVRKRVSKGFQFEGNYVLSKDLDDDSNERDPFTDRAVDINNLQLDYSLADRDIRHKFNFYLNGNLPKGIEVNTRIQARSAQPITLGTRGLVPPATTARNDGRKNNEYFSFDWRLSKTFRIAERYSIIPTIEMFNTFNNRNLINPLSTPGLFNFDGFLRQGVGDPRQLQLAAKFTF